MTRSVIPEACVHITYSIVSAKRDAFRDASSICKTRVTSVTVMDMPYLDPMTRIRGDVRGGNVKENKKTVCVKVIQTNCTNIKRRGEGGLKEVSMTNGE